MEPMYQVTLSSGKVVLLREPKMKHLRLAEKLTNGNQGLAFQEELLKQLLFKIDDAEVKKPDLLDLDDILAISDVIQLGQVLQKLLGKETGTNVKMEQVFGGQ